MTRKEKDLAKHLKVQFTSTILLLDEKGATIARINAACMELPAFDAARPEKQADAPASA